MYGANVIIFEGIMAFCNEDLCKVRNAVLVCKIVYQKM